VKYTLCDITEIEDPGSRAFELIFNHAPLEIFVVQSNASLRAYVNSCPHTGANLDWQENQFLDLDKCFIQCSTHDALFDIDSGLCIAGPCVDKSLQALELSSQNGSLVVHIPDDFINANACGR